MLKVALLCNKWQLLQCCLGTYDPGGGAFALFLRPYRGAFGSFSAPTPGNLPSKKEKMLMPGG